MRRLTALVQEERGATAVMVALLLTPLIGFAALAVDVGSLYFEQAQLQNGADAAALAIGNHCAHPVDAGTSSGSIANQLTAANNVATPDTTTVLFAGGGECAGGKVTVTAKRTDASHPLAAAASLVTGPVPVSATGTVVWGSPSSSTVTLPIAISECEANKSALTATAGVQLLQLNDSSGKADATKTPCAGVSYPGGFGWLSNAVCAIHITTGWNDAVPGKSYPGACDQTFSVIKGQIVLVPLYNDFGGSGSNGQYYVDRFAAFQITGWTFTGNNDSPDLTGPACTGSCNGIWGRFLTYTFTSTDTTAFGGPSTGTTVVQLIK